MDITWESYLLLSIFFLFHFFKLKENFMYKVKIKFRKYNFFLPFTIVT